MNPPGFDQHEQGLDNVGMHKAAKVLGQPADRSRVLAHAVTDCGQQVGPQPAEREFVGAELTATGLLRGKGAKQPKVLVIGFKHLNPARQGQVARGFFQCGRVGEELLALNTDRAAGQHLDILAQQFLYLFEINAGRSLAQNLKAGARLQAKIGQPGLGIVGGDAGAFRQPVLETRGAGFFIRPGQGPNQRWNTGRKGVGEADQAVSQGRLLSQADGLGHRSQQRQQAGDRRRVRANHRSQDRQIKRLETWTETRQDRWQTEKNLGGGGGGLTGRVLGGMQKGQALGLIQVLKTVRQTRIKRPRPGILDQGAESCPGCYFLGTQHRQGSRRRRKIRHGQKLPLPALAAEQQPALLGPDAQV